jgi:hypothetical protein
MSSGSARSRSRELNSLSESLPAANRINRAELGIVGEGKERGIRDKGEWDI